MPRPPRHRKSQRLKQFDYTTNGAYFVTICTHDQINSFGEVKNGEMIGNACGEIVTNCWLDLPDHYAN